MRVSPLALSVALLAASCGGIGSDSPSQMDVPPRLAAGSDISCVIVDDGGVACWGHRGYMGAGFTPGDAELGISGPVAVALPEGVRFVRVSVSRNPYGLRHACALSSEGAAWCWGDDQSGQLGRGGEGPCCGEAPYAVAMPDATTFTEISAGFEHTCALARDRTVWCWGEGSYGQLADGSPTEDDWNAGMDHSVDRPTRVSLPDAVTVASVATGGFFSCALTTTGAVLCWGEDNSFLPKARPVEMPLPPDVAFSTLAASEGQLCGLTAEGTVWCWADTAGSGRSEENSFGATAPERVAGPDGVAFSRLTAGRAHFCAVSTSGTVWCWGAWGGFGTPGDYYGEVPFPEESEPSPVAFASTTGRRFTDIAAGDGQTCGIATDSTIWCWGANDWGQLGDGTTRASRDPVEVPIDLAAAAPAPSPQALPSLEPVVLEPYAGAAFLSPPPIWTLGSARSRRIFSVFRGNWRIPEHWGLPDRCRSTGDGPSGSPEECLLAYFAKLGASLESLSLLRDYGVTVTRVAGSAPVWVAETYDWSTFETNSDGAPPNLIFTPEGIIDVSSYLRGGQEIDLSAAFETALATDVAGRIEAVAAEVWQPGIYLGAYDENFEVPLLAPRRTASGWTVPFGVQSGGGFHCCSYPFWARFELDLSSRGSIVGVRFLDWCFVERVTFGSGEIPDAWPDSVTDLGGTMPACAEA